jgi:hypothetical protein
MNDNQHAETGDPLLVAGGVALVLLGTGLILSHPGIRRAVLERLRPLLSQLEEPLKAGTSSMVSDLGRYMKIRDM